MLLPSADTAELERAMTTLFARFGGMGFAELQKVDPREFRDFAIEFGDVVRSLPFQLPENFLLIIRAMSLTSGMCSSLDPAFNIWDAVEPYAGQLLRDERGNVVQALRAGGGVGRRHRRTAAAAARRPRDADRGRPHLGADPRLERRMASLERTGRRVISAVLFAALFVGGILLRADDAIWARCSRGIAAAAAARAVRRLGQPASALSPTQSRSPTRSGISNGRWGSHDAGSGHGREDGRWLSMRRSAASLGLAGAGDARTR